jgi:Holliday junction resolvase-like predicted endonuclease
MLVDGIEFSFPPDWEFEKYDDWVFYKNQFQSVGEGQKAVDIVARDPQKTLWFIEVKDYRRYQRTKLIDLADEVAHKVRDTMAGLLASSVHAEGSEKIKAKGFIQIKNIRVVLQLEQPKQHSRLFPRAIDPAAIQQKLRKAVKAIDAHPIVTESLNKHKKILWDVH